MRAQSRQAIAYTDQLLDTARSLGAPTSHPDGAIE